MKISDLQKKIEEKRKTSSGSTSPPLVKRERDRPESDIIEPIDIQRRPSKWLRPNLGCGRNYMD